ncbi:hypothetical protein [Hyunsoonleella rubra]|uniref:Por secretion system C-terminal sorting domain-containing protein n=1 Tax=Hyunsoonleella rubra TaxID=1737062 RepID=A0ABW5T949_9FLAO
MKNVIKHSKKVFLMVALFATVMGYANESLFYASTNEDDRIVLTLTNVKEGNLFTIKDQNGVILYKESIQKSGNYTKGFDFTKLPNGSYIVELDKDVEINVIPLTVKGLDVSFDKSMIQTFYKPVTRIKSDKVFVTKLALDRSPLSIKIYFENSDFGSTEELVYAETIENAKVIERIYKLTGLEEGNYKIVYKSKGRTFVEYI